MLLQVQQEVFKRLSKEEEEARCVVQTQSRVQLGQINSSSPDLLMI